MFKDNSGGACEMLIQVNFHMTFAQVIMRSWLEFTGLGIS